MKIDRDAPVGVFDSGIGGLTVAREIMRNISSRENRVFRRYCQSSIWKQIQRDYYRIFPSDNPFPERAEGEGDCGGL